MRLVKRDLARSKCSFLCLIFSAFNVIALLIGPAKETQAQKVMLSFLKAANQKYMLKTKIIHFIK